MKVENLVQAKAKPVTAEAENCHGTPPRKWISGAWIYHGSLSELTTRNDRQSFIHESYTEIPDAQDDERVQWVVGKLKNKVLNQMYSREKPIGKKKDALEKEEVH